MKEIRSSGTREFIDVVIWALVFLLIRPCIVNAFPAYKVAGEILILIMFCVLAYFATTRYAAVFTYENTGYSLRINRKIGKRNKEIEIPFRDILSISSKKPTVRQGEVYHMRVSVFSNKKSKFVTFRLNNNINILEFEPSDVFIKKLKQSIKRNGD